MERTASTTDRRAVEYRLTRSGRALFPVLIGLTQWASEHLCDGQAAIRFVERENGREIAPLNVLSADGRPLKLADIAMVAGPDADKALGTRLQAAVQATESATG